MESLASLVDPLYSMIYEPYDTINIKSNDVAKSTTSFQQSPHNSNDAVNNEHYGIIESPTSSQHLVREQHSPHNTVHDNSHGVTKSSIGFQHLPRELRDEVYQYVIGDIRQLDFHKTGQLGMLCQDRPRYLLLRHIPRCLCLNRQILNEALETAPDRVSGIKAFSPRDTTCVYPSDKLLHSVRRLEFTSSQPFYSSNERGRCSAPEDVASRCPQLEELTLLLPATKDTMNNFASDLVNIFENKNLVKLTLAYQNAPIQGWDTEYSLFQPLESWFLRESEEKGRRIAFTIDLAPGKVSRSIEESKTRTGCIEYMQYLDIFG